MRKIKKISTLILIVMALTAMTGCQTLNNFVSTWITHEAVERSVIRIGVYEPLSGKDKEAGELEKMGIELAHKLYPTVLGKEVELVYGDNQSDVYVGETVAQDLVEKGVSVVLGSYGSVNSMVGAPIFSEAEIPAIAITNTNPLVTSNNAYYFRICFVESFQGIALAKYTVEKLGINQAAVLMPRNDDRAQAVSQKFRDKMSQLTGNPDAVALTVEFDSDIEDFTTQLTRIRDSGIKVCFVPAEVHDSIRILNSAKQMDIKCLFLGTDDWENEGILYQTGVEGAGSIAFSTLFDEAAGTSETDKFMQAFHGEYGAEAVPQNATVLAYDAYLLAIKAIREAGTATRGELIANQILMQHEFQGASGSISFNEIGDPTKSVSIKTIIKDEFKTIYTVRPSWVVVSPEEFEKMKSNT